MTSMTLASVAKCVLCGLDCGTTATGDNPDVKTVDCQRCSPYIITRTAIKCIQGCDSVIKDQLYLLSGLLRNRSENNQPLTTLDEKDFGNEVSCQKYFDEKVLPFVPKGVQAKADLLLRYLGKASAQPGATVTVRSDWDYPTAYCKNAGEHNFYIDHLLELGLVKGGSTSASGRHLILTAEGWKRLETLRTPNTESSQAFVAMSFSEDLLPIYTEGIKPLRETTGFEMVRVDGKEFLGDILDQIVADIRQSRFVIADVTGHSRGVYFEGGYAMALGLPVIWTCREDDFKTVHFDISHYNHIVWKNPADLNDRLGKRILATVGKCTSAKAAV